MDLTHWAGWTPLHIGWGQSGPVVEWCYTGRRRFTAPFFEQDVAALMAQPFHLLFRRQTSLDVLEQLHAARPGLRPSGFIFHMSRCGSTLISQMLATLPQNIVISEAPPFDFVLHAHLYNPALTADHRIAALQWVVSALAQPDPLSPTPQRLFLKFSAWHTLDLALMQKAFPGVPWLFVYREPLEVMVSNLQTTSSQMLPTPVALALFGLSPAEVAAMSQEEYMARYLARICEAGLEQRQQGRFVNYRELPEAVWTWLPEYFGVSYGTAELAAIQQAGQFNAKNPGQRFTPDSQSKQQEASALARQMTTQWIEPLYDRLEAARKFVSQSEA